MFNLKFKMDNALKYTILSSILLLFFSGCAAKQEYKVAYEQHEKEFKAKHPYTTHAIKRGNHSLHVREFGLENRAKAPTILLMHGFPDSLHLYDELIPHLSQKRHVIAFDFLGWGNSDKPLDHKYDTQSLKADIQSVVEYFKLDDLVVVVHDASGPAGIEWALENESKVNTLVLLNTFYHPMASLTPPEAIALFSTPGIKRSIAIFVTSNSDARWQAGLMEQLNKFMSNEEMRQKYSKILAHQSLGIRPAFFGLNDVLTEEVQSRKDTAVKELSTFEKPVMIIFGNDDLHLNHDVAKEFHSIFANSTLNIINNAGHYVQVDKSKEVAEFMLKTN